MSGEFALLVIYTALSLLVFKQLRALCDVGGSEPPPKTEEEAREGKAFVRRMVRRQDELLRHSDNPHSAVVRIFLSRI